MNSISVRHDIADEVSRQGYSLVPASEFSFSPTMEAYKESLLEEWKNLELDIYMADGGKYRFRRFGIYLFHPLSGELTYQPGAKYYQSLEYNPLNGGVERALAHLRPQMLENPFFRELIFFDFRQFTIDEKLLPCTWKVGIHQHRVIARPRMPGHPSPEGIHQDGEKLTAQHLIGRKNITGGTFQLYDQQRRSLAEWTQLNHFDSVYWEEPQVMHAVTPLVLDGDYEIGMRDVLLIGYDPILEEK